MELKKHMLVISGFIEKDNKYLLVKCAKFKDWRVPGGRAEPLEKAEETLKREMKEELDVDIINIKFVGYGQDFREIAEKDITLSRTVLYFSCNTKGNINPNKEEILQFKWASLEEIRNFPGIENAMKDFFSRFKEDEL